MTAAEFRIIRIIFTVAIQITRIFSVLMPSAMAMAMATMASMEAMMRMEIQRIHVFVIQPR